ncbi:MAG: TonB-dependent receptor plug domain-containing protein [Bacteroidales bacterium]
MKTQIRATLLLTLLFLTIGAFASVKQKRAISETVINRFSNLWNKVPQEKAYLHTDKPYYIAGEDLWFKGYVLNATTHQQNTLSQFLYVELIDKSDSVFHRVKIRRDSLGFAGRLKLQPEMPSGIYALRAYTNWMQNAGTDFFFSKNIYIGNPIDDRVNSLISYGKPTTDGKIPVTISFTNASQKPISGKAVSINQNWSNASRKKVTQTTNIDGKIMFLISVDLKNHNTKSLDIAINDPYLKYKNRFFLPEFSKDFDVQFFPESGNLINKVLQTIAFKAIGSDGLSVNITGQVFSKSDTLNEICDIATLHKGMGKFVIEPKASDTLYAIVKSEQGLVKRFNLPKVNNQGVILRINQLKGKIMFEVTNQTALPDSSLYLLAHCRGKVFVMQQLHHLVGQIATENLPEGILTFSVIDSSYQTLCERLSFIQKGISSTIKMESNKKSYRKREAVNLKFIIQSATALPVKGSFSVSVTDSRTVKTDSLADNMVSYLLLSSDLKGHLEDPASYFINNKNDALNKLDVLLLTQGWKRFTTSNIVKGVYPISNSYLEVGQALSGKVKNFFGKPAKNNDIISISAYKNRVQMTKTDSLGRYMISGIEFPDSTSFIIKAKKRKSIADVEIIPDFDEFPKFSAYIPVPKNSESQAPEAYLKQSKEKYYYEGGVRMINLNEVVVTGQKINSESDNHFYTGLADGELTADNLSKFPGSSILNMLSTIAGVNVMGESISIRGSLGQPLILIDEIEVEGTEELSYLTTNDVENISVFKGANAAIFGSRGGNGVIAITLKKGIVLKAQTPISLAFVQPLGYQKPAEFYVPKYDVDSVRMTKTPDLRTTIYWNPKLSTDSTGTIQFQFYAADKTNDYEVTLEGITSEGEPCRYVGILRREDN